jgi:glycosyltransferase involved in cell wall biosynthesis
MIRVVHLITGLNIGGAERMLQRLSIAHRSSGAAESIVVSLTSLGRIGEELRSEGIRVEAIGLHGLLTIPMCFLRLVRLLRDLKPDVVQTWLYHADLFGALAARLAGVGHIAWNIRCTAFGSGRITGLLSRINARLSWWLPDSIVCCGLEAKRHHIDLGYNSAKMVVLPNGYDLNWFCASGRLERDNADTDVRIVAIGRNDPLKDYPLLLVAMSLLRQCVPEVRCKIYGNGCPGDPALASQIGELGLSDIVTLAPELADVRAAFIGADIFCSSSMNEGFPNVIAEAMAMAIPCVTTDAGDARMIVGDAGTVVPARDANALAAGLLDLAMLGRQGRHILGLRARQRIADNFELTCVADSYYKHYLAGIGADQNGKH